MGYLELDEEGQLESEIMFKHGKPSGKYTSMRMVLKSKKESQNTVTMTHPTTLIMKLLINAYENGMRIISITLYIKVFF